MWGPSTGKTRSGNSCVWLRWQQSPAYVSGKEQWDQKRRWLVSNLRQTRKPLAFFASSDGQALEVLAICETAGILVPEEIAIVGVENYSLSPDLMRIPLSSVDVNLELLAYRAAALLADLMSGAKPPESPLRVPPLGVVTRKSSDIIVFKHEGVAKSLRFLWDHAHQPITLKDLASAADMPMRTLHAAFLKNLGRTPGDELRRVRIERAKRLLAGERLKIEVLANMCGYRNPSSFCRTFKRMAGITPKQFEETIISRQACIAAPQ